MASRKTGMTLHMILLALLLLLLLGLGTQVGEPYVFRDGAP